MVRPSRTKAHAALEVLLTGVREPLREDQVEAWVGTRLALRRDMLLNPSIDARGPNSAADFSVNIDLFDLVDEAKAPGNELEVLLGPLDEADRVGARLQEARTRTTMVLRKHELQLDEFLKTNVEGALSAKQELRAAAMSGDVAEARRLHQRSFAFAKRVYDLNHRLAQQLAVLLQSIGEFENADAWLARFDQSCFPETMRPTTVDHLHDWLIQNVAMTEQARRQINTLYESHQLARASIRDELKRLVIALRQQVSPYICGSNDSDVFEDIDEVRTALRASEETVHQSFLALLSQDDRSRYKAALEQAQRRSGPFFDTQQFLRRGWDFSRRSTQSDKDKRHNEANDH